MNLAAWALKVRVEHHVISHGYIKLSLGRKKRAMKAGPYTKSDLRRLHIYIPEVGLSVGRQRCHAIDQLTGRLDLTRLVYPLATRGLLGFINSLAKGTLTW